MVLVSQYDPKAGFNAGHAMQRNKLIYALSDAGLVIDAAHNEGGTWAGAVEQLDKLRFVPVFIRSEGVIGAGLEGLRRKGASPWANPETPDEFSAVLAGEYLPATAESHKQANFLTDDSAVVEPDKAAPGERQTPSAEPESAPELSAAETLFATAEQHIASLGDTVKEPDVMAHLKIEKKQAEAWLKRLVDEGKYERRKRPAVHYVKVQAQTNALL